MIWDHGAISLALNRHIPSSSWVTLCLPFSECDATASSFMEWWRGACAVLLRVQEGAGLVLQLIDLSSLLQRLIWHLSLLLLTQSSAFPKSFTPMGIFEFDKLHCLRGDKREQSWFLFKPGHSVVTRHVFKQTATPGAHQKKKRTGNGSG